MADNTKDLMVKLSLDMAQFKREMDKVSDMTKRAMDNLGKTVQKSANNFDALESAVKDLKTDVSKSFTNMEKSVKDSSKDMQKSFESSFGKMTGAVKNLAGAIITAVSAREIFQFGQDVVEAAADLEALNAAFEQVFVDELGSHTDTATKNLEKMCAEWDMEINSLKDSYTSFTSQFKGLGMDMDTAMTGASDALTLAADAAAMFNMPLEEAITHVRSFIKGNAEGGEAIQLFQSATMLGAYAVEQGIVAEADAFKELSETEKQLIRIDFAKHQYDIAGVTGQAARESDMYANQLTKLKQRWTDFKAVLGTKALEGAVGAFKGLGDALDKVDAEGLGEAFNGALNVLSSVVAFGADKLATFLNWLASVDWWLAGRQIATCWEMVRDTCKPIWDWICAIVAPIGDALSSIWKPMGDANISGMDAVNQALFLFKERLAWIIENKDVIITAIGGIALAFAGFKLGTFIPVITGIVGKLGGLLLYVKAIPAFFAKAIFAFKAAGGGLAGLAGAMGSSALAAAAIPLAIAGVLVAIWYFRDEIWAVCKVVWEKLKPIVNALMEFGKALWDFTMSIVAPIAQKIAYVVVTIWQEIVKIWNSAKPFIMELIEFIVTMVERFIYFATDCFNAVKPYLDKIVAIIQGIVTFITVVTTTVIKVVSWCIQMIIQIIRAMWLILEPIIMGVWQLFKVAFELIAKIIQWFCRVLFGSSEDMKKTLNGFKDKIKDLKDKGKEYLDKFVSFFAEMPEKISKAITKGKTIVQNAFIGLINSGIEGAVNSANGLIKAMNWVLEKLGMEKIGEIDASKYKVPLKKYAKGTSGHNGGMALVGEAGRELVHDNGKTFMVNQASLLNLSRGAKVLSNPKTEKMLKQAGIPAFAKGKDESWWEKGKNKVKDLWATAQEKIGDIWGYITDPTKLVKKLFDTFGIGSGDSGGNIFIKGAFGWLKGLADKVVDWVVAQFAIASPSGEGGMANLADYITSKFGWRVLGGKSELHKGIDLAGGIFGAGKPVYSQSSGRVLTSGYSDSAGYWNVIQTGDLIYKYMHMMAGSLTKAVGQMVQAGEQIGKVGNTGRSFGAHLHFQVEKNGTPVDPSSYFTGVGYGGNGSISKKASAWTNEVLRAAKEMGVTLSSTDLARVIQQINTESGGNAGLTQSMAVNDINARTGNLAKGLLQFVPSTFRNYAVKGHTNIWSGYDQLLALFNIEGWRKYLPELGVKRGWTPRGKRRRAANGILVDGATALTVGEAGQEAVVPLSNARALKPFGQSVMNAFKEEAEEMYENGGSIEIVVPLYIDGKEVAKATAPYTQAELDKLTKRQNRINGKK